jgi:hypothetical protein
MTRGCQENYINAAEKLRVGRAFIGIDQRRGLPNNPLRHRDENFDYIPRVHLNSNASKLSRLIVAPHKYRGNYDMGANGKEGYTLVGLTESSGKAYALTNLANQQ